MISNQGGRTNQKLRTRQALLDAAAALLSEGATPQVADVAERAEVSRATAFRYFPSQDALLLEALVGGWAKTPDELFPAGSSDDPEERAVIATRSYFGLACSRPTEFRNFLRLCMKGTVEREPGASGPSRQGRRLQALAGALAPVAKRLGASRARRLGQALAVFAGVETMVVLEDVCGLDARAGAAVVEWATRALVRQAIAEAGPARRASRPPRRRS